jgi:hypothetical protein
VNPETTGTPQESGYITARCPRCFVEGPLKPGNLYLCIICGAKVDPAKHALKAHHVRRSMLDDNSGMRKRRRESMGFRQAGLVDAEGIVDPEAGGRKLEQMTAAWMESSFHPWDTAQRPETGPRSWLEKALMVAVGLLLAGTLVASGVWYFQNESPSAAVAEEPQAADSRAEFDRLLPERSVAAEKAVRGFLAARDVETLLPLVRDRARVEPALRAWYRDQPPFTQPITRVQLHGAARVGREVYLRMLAETDDFRQVVVTLEETPAGWLADWESFVAWGEVLWEDLQQGKNVAGAPALVRGYLSFAEHYRPPFEPGVHQAFQLRGPSGGVVLKAWMAADPLALIYLRGALFDAGAAEIEVIVRVQPVAGSGVEITAVQQTGWILRARAGETGVLFQKPPQ